MKIFHHFGKVVPPRSPINSVDLFIGHSLSRLTASYNDEFVRIRRSSDSEEADFGAGDFLLTDSSIASNSSSGGIYDGEPLSTFCSGTNGFAVVIRDQSGGGRNSTQTSTDAQPQIVESGSVITQMNGRASMVFDGDNDFFNLPDLSDLTEGEVFWVVRAANDPPLAEKSGSWRCGTGQENTYPYSNGIIYDGFGSTARKTTVNPTPSLASPRLYNVLSKSGEWTSRLDGSQLYTTATNTTSFPSSDNKLGASSTSLFFDGDTSEFLLYDTDKSTDRTAINTNIGGFYNIF
jgi:hypothetical protein